MRRLIPSPVPPEAVNEFAYPPRGWSSPPGEGEEAAFLFVFPSNATSGCNGCKSIHSKVKQFVLPAPLLC